MVYKYYCNKYNIKEDGLCHYVKEEQTKHNKDQFDNQSVWAKIGQKSQSGYQWSISYSTQMMNYTKKVTDPLELPILRDTKT